MLPPHPFRLFANPNAGTPGVVVLPDRAFNTSRPTATFEDSVFMRLADPNDTSHGQACN